jgi:hypothetical protein
MVAIMVASLIPASAAWSIVTRLATARGLRKPLRIAKLTSLLCLLLVATVAIALTAKVPF